MRILHGLVTGLMTLLLNFRKLALDRLPQVPVGL